MKRQNILVIIAFLAACGYLVSLQFPKKERLGQTPKTGKSNVELELRIEQLNDLLQAIIQANLVRHTVEQEKPQPGLIQKLQEVTAQKEALRQELIQAKTGLELVRPTKQKENTANKIRIENLMKRLKEKDNALAALKKQLGEEKAGRQADSKDLKRASRELKMAKNTKSALEGALSETEKKKEGFKTTNASLKLEINKSGKELKSLRNTLEQLSKEKQALAKELEEARAASLGTEKLRKDIEQLRAQLELLNKTYADLRNEYLKGQEVLKQNEIESGRRADRILVLQEKLTQAEAQLADTQLKYKEMEKESALVREQNVAVQLEREDLKNQLEQAKLRLNELGNQVSQISNILKTVKTAEAALPKEEAERVEVELFPASAQTVTQEADK